jgi:biotin-[acetyl-CoA-carboxylase] ligase BirA-like protein
MFFSQYVVWEETKIWLSMFTHLHFKECDSTNSRALAWVKDGAPHKGLVTCDTQTAGRGQFDRKWLHCAGSIACSFILRPQLPINQVAPITLITAAAIMQSLQSLGLNSSVKYPNDLLLPDGRKFAGILTEAQSTNGMTDSVIIGIGLNVQRAPEAPKKYGFLSDLGYTGHSSMLLEHLVPHLEFHFEQLGNENHWNFCLSYLENHLIEQPIDGV